MKMRSTKLTRDCVTQQLGTRKQSSKIFPTFVRQFATTRIQEMICIKYLKEYFTFSREMGEQKIGKIMLANSQMIYSKN